MSQMFVLPSRSTPSSWLQSLQVMPGFCQDVIEATAFDDRQNVSERFLAYDCFNDLIVGDGDYSDGQDRKKLEPSTAVIWYSQLQGWN